VRKEGRGTFEVDVNGFLYSNITSYANVRKWEMGSRRERYKKE
jgi:hypothetical protein